MKIANKRAFFDYQITEKFEAGINLYGYEVKSLKLGHADLTGSYVKISGSEAYLINAKIFPYAAANISEYDQRRTRKLLLHKAELISLKNKIEGSNNMALVPISFYTKHNLIKVEIGLGKGKRKFEKKENIKKKDIERQIEQELQS